LTSRALVSRAQHAAIRANILQDVHKQYIMWQALKALKFMHSANLLHRDMKPSNLLLNSDCLMKVADFGLARSMHEPKEDAEEQRYFTDYIATRWYRAPEILLGSNNYSEAVDMWGVGCILGELLQRHPIFPGENYLHQLQLVTEVLGSPSEEDLEFVRAPAARSFMQRLPGCAGVPLAQQFPHVRGPCLDLLQRMLTFSPTKRITVEDALTQPYLASLHDPSDEPLAHAEFSFEFERMALNKQVLHELVTKEMLAFHPEFPSSSSSAVADEAGLAGQLLTCKNYCKFIFQK
jgi:serine/threonine protein kinase